MTIDLAGTLLRACAIQREAMLALSTPVTADAYEYFLHVQSVYPYFINRVGAWEIDPDSEDFDIYNHTLIMRLVIGHITSGYEGEHDGNLQLYIPHITTYFNQRELLQSAAYPTRPDDLTQARCSDGTGLQFFKHTGINGETLQVGTEWTLRCTFEEIIEQQYL